MAFEQTTNRENNEARPKTPTYSDITMHGMMAGRRRLMAIPTRIAKIIVRGFERMNVKSLRHYTDLPGNQDRDQE